MVGEDRAEAVPARRDVRPRRLCEVAQDGHGATHGAAPPQGTSLHGREVLCLVGDDVPVAARGLPADEDPELFEADVVVEGPGIGVGTGGTGPQQGRLLPRVEHPVGAGVQEVRRVVEGAQGLPGARGRPDAFDQALDPAVALQVAADRTGLPAPWCDVGELLEETVDEQAAEAVAALPVGAVALVCLVEEGQDLGPRHAQGRTAGGDDDRGLVAFEGGRDDEVVECFGAVVVLHAAAQDGGHALVGLHASRLRGVGAEYLAVPQAVQLDGVDVPGAERGQDLADVLQEPLVGADHQDVLGLEVVVVDEPGHAVETDRGLAGARAALHDEDVGGGTGDQLHLVAADGLDDVAHAAAARSLELAQQEVVRLERLAALPADDVARGGRGRRPGLRNGRGYGSGLGFRCPSGGGRRSDVVEIALHDPLDAAQLAPQRHLTGALGPGVQPLPREGAGPLQDHRLVRGVPHDPPSDVPGAGLRAGLLRRVDPGEHQGLVAESSVRGGTCLRVDPVGDPVLAARGGRGRRRSAHLGQSRGVAVVRVVDGPLLDGEVLAPSGGAHVRPPCGAAEAPLRACARTPLKQLSESGW